MAAIYLDCVLRSLFSRPPGGTRVVDQDVAAAGDPPALARDEIFGIVFPGLSPGIPVCGYHSRVTGPDQPERVS